MSGAADVKPSRRRLGLSLRVLMLLVLLLAVGMGWLAYRARVQRQAVAAIEAAGGQVSYDWDLTDDLDLQEDLRPPKSPWPKWLIKALGIDYFGNVTNVYSRTGQESVFFGNVRSPYSKSGEGLRIDDALMASIGRLAHLQDLRIDGSPLTDAGLVHLRGLTRLEELHIDNTPGVTDAGMVYLAGLKQLRVLHIVDSGIKGPGLASLVGLNRLEELDLSIPVTDADLVPVSKMVSLRHFFLYGDSPRLTDAGLVHLKGLMNLEMLSLTSDRLTDAGLVHLSGLTNLEALNLNGRRAPGITSDGLVHLKGMKRLVHLQLEGSSVVSLEPLSHLTGLSVLFLDGTSVDDSSLATLAGFRGLQTLSLAKTRVGDAGLAHIAKLSQLGLLTLGETKVTPSGIAALQKALPSVQIFP
jgi:internalin A